MIGGNDFGLILSKEECFDISNGMSKLLLLAGKSKDSPKEYYKYLVKIGIMQFMEELKSAYKEES